MKRLELEQAKVAAAAEERAAAGRERAEERAATEKARAEERAGAQKNQEILMQLLNTSNLRN